MTSEPSRGVVTAIVLLLSSAASGFGLVISDGDQHQLIGFITAIIGAVGGAASWYFRVVAKKQVTGLIMKSDKEL